MTKLPSSTEKFKNQRDNTKSFWTHPRPMLITFNGLVGYDRVKQYPLWLKSVSISTYSLLPVDQSPFCLSKSRSIPNTSTCTLTTLNIGPTPTHMPNYCFRSQKLLFLRSPKGGCCSISNDLSCSHLNNSSNFATRHYHFIIDMFKTTIRGMKPIIFLKMTKYWCSIQEKSGK